MSATWLRRTIGTSARVRVVNGKWLRPSVGPSTANAEQKEHVVFDPEHVETLC